MTDPKPIRTPKSHLIVQLHDEGRLTWPEIAKAVGVSKASVRKTLSRYGRKSKHKPGRPAKQQEQS